MTAGARRAPQLEPVPHCRQSWAMPDTRLTLPHWDALATQADDTLPLFSPPRC